MSTSSRRRQRGATLLIGMIMLVVLTLLVLFAIRSGNTNLRIAGNMQTQAEVGAAAQQAIEQVIEQIKLPTTDISQIKAQTVTVPVGNTTYNVAVKAMGNKCLMEIPVLNSALNPSNANDVPCFESPDEDKVILSDNTVEQAVGLQDAAMGDRGRRDRHRHRCQCQPGSGHHGAGAGHNDLSVRTKRFQS